MSEYVADQPVHGETVLYCGHTAPATHSFCMGDRGQEADFTRPDGSTGKTRWMIVCEPCLATITDLNDVPALIKADTTWVGNTPAFKKTALEDKPKVMRGW